VYAKSCPDNSGWTQPLFLVTYLAVIANARFGKLRSFYIGSAPRWVWRERKWYPLTAAGDSMHCTYEVTVIGDQGILQAGIWGERLLFKSIKDSGTRPLGTALPSTT
jgi:hypothetical protein